MGVEAHDKTAAQQVFLMMGNDWDNIVWRSGQREKLVGRIQERYEVAREAAEQQVNEFTRSYELARTAKVS
jgi:hypothetical protein